MLKWSLRCSHWVRRWSTIWRSPWHRHTPTTYLHRIDYHHHHHHHHLDRLSAFSSKPSWPKLTVCVTRGEIALAMTVSIFYYLQSSISRTFATFFTSSKKCRYLHCSSLFCNIFFYFTKPWVPRPNISNLETQSSHHRSSLIHKTSSQMLSNSILAKRRHVNIKFVLLRNTWFVLSFLLSRPNPNQEEVCEVWPWGWSRGGGGTGY